jgi:hypothetical protein
MNCRRARNLVFELVDGLPDERVRADLESHLAACPECEDLANQLTRSMDLVHRAPVEELDENFNWKVRLAIHRERQAMASPARGRADFRAWNLRYAASAVGAFALVVAAGWLAFGTGTLRLEKDAATPALMSRLVTNSGGYSDFGQRGRSAASPVSEGVGVRAKAGPARQGAIGESNTPAYLDSLLRVETMDMTDAERIQYLEARIRLYNQHLDRYRSRDE